MGEVGRGGIRLDTLFDVRQVRHYKNTLKAVLYNFKGN